jgi:hypothetical protein
MRQAIYNISAIRNDTWQGVSFAVTVNGVAADLTGSKITMNIADENGNIIKTIDNDTIGGITLTTAGAFSVDSFIPVFAEGKYDYDIQILFLSGTVKTYIKGKFCLVGDI